MSTGSVFKILTNDGKSDRLIQATAFLNQRLKQITCARKARGEKNVMPTLEDIEQTHVLYVKSQLKPHVAIGFEYNKVNTNSGQAQHGQDYSFLIPQFGDFFHDMVTRTQFDSFQANSQTAPVQGTAEFPANAAGTFYRLVDAMGREVAGGATYRNLVRWCEHPADAQFTKVAFDVNGNPLDNYTRDASVMCNKFDVLPHKRAAFDRLSGQERPHHGYSGLFAMSVVDADAANTPANITRNTAGQSNQQVALFANPATPAGQVLTTLNASATQFDLGRECKQMVNGPQTPKHVQPRLEVWHKLQFWYCREVENSIPSVSIPQGQRYINITGAPQSDLHHEVCNLYLETSTETATPLATFVPRAPNAPLGAIRQVTYSPIFGATRRVGFTGGAISKIELYINNIFLNPEIHDIYIERIGFSLVRVFREQKASINTDRTHELLLSALKWPVEYMLVGLQPNWNVSANNLNRWRDWHRYTRQVDATNNNFDVAMTPSGAAAVALGSTVGQIQPDSYWLPVPTVDSLGLTSHGITIFDDLPDQFFSGYMQLHYGPKAVVSSEDPGLFMLSMALKPNETCNGSGHLNFSRARENYIRFFSSYMSAATPCHARIVAKCINFLLVADGSAQLRYST